MPSPNPLRDVLVRDGLLIIETPDGTDFDSTNRDTSLGAADGMDHLNSFDPDLLQEFTERVGSTWISSPPRLR